MWDEEKIRKHLKIYGASEEEIDNFIKDLQEDIEDKVEEFDADSEEDFELED